MEQWKDIYYFDYVKNEWIDFRGIYQISNKGNVKSLNYRQTETEKILKLAFDERGYLLTNLCKNGKQKTFRVHRLVAFMFIENDDPFSKIQINHIDENKRNNNVENLEWCTNDYNNHYGTRTERAGNSMKGEKHPLYKKYGSDSHRAKKVICVTTGETFGSVIEAALKYGIDASSISKCCLGKRKSVKKMIWKFLTEGDKE